MIFSYTIKKEPNFTSIVFYRKVDNTVSKSSENIENPLSSTEKAPNSAEKLPNNAEKQIVDFLNENERIYTEDVELILNVKERRAREILNNMTKKRLLEKIGKTKGSYYILNKDEK